MRKLNPSMLIALLALFVALGGTAMATSGLISGHKIKNRTISQKKLSLATIKSLKGKKGPRGFRGLQGVPGPIGPPAQDGVFTKTGTLTNQPANTEVEVVKMNLLPSNRYVLDGKINIKSPTAAVAECAIGTDGGGATDTGLWSAPVNNSLTVMPLQLVSFAFMTSVSIYCQSSGANASYTADVRARPFFPTGP
jgi:hypothetical protein